MRVGVDPVALEALAVRVGDHPAGAREAPVVVGQVDVGLPVLPHEGERPTEDLGVALCVRPVPEARVEQAVGAEGPVRAGPVALERAAGEVAGHDPAVPGDPAVVVGPVAAVLEVPAAAQDVALLGGVVRPALLGVALDRGVRVGVDPVALERAVSLVLVGHNPAGTLEPALVVGKVEIGLPILGVHVLILSAGDIAFIRTEEPALYPVDHCLEEVGAKAHALALVAKPVALEPRRPSVDGLVSNKPTRRLSSVCTIVNVVFALLLPSAQDGVANRSSRLSDDALGSEGTIGNSVGNEGALFVTPLGAIDEGALRCGRPLPDIGGFVIRSAGRLTLGLSRILRPGRDLAIVTPLLVRARSLLNLLFSRDDRPLARASIANLNRGAHLWYGCIDDLGDAWDRAKRSRHSGGRESRTDRTGGFVRTKLLCPRGPSEAHRKCARDGRRQEDRANIPLL